MGTQQEHSSKTHWHRLFGALLESLLTPLGVEVFMDFPVMKTPPEADIVLLRRDRPAWTVEQQAVLPDGIRECPAGHVILEFKYTESLTDQAFRQAIGYDYFYRESNNLKADDVQTAVVSAKTPHRATLRRFGYSIILKPGVYQSTSPLLERILLLVSNQLEDTIHNAPVKCFASRRIEQRQAFALLQTCRSLSFSQRFWWLLNGLWGQFFVERSEYMQKELTPEQITEWGKMWEERFLSHVPVEKRLAGVKPEDILQYYTLDEMLAKVKPEDVLSKFTLEDMLAKFPPEEIERYLRTHQHTAS